jgi:hypothetical protein
MTTLARRAMDKQWQHGWQIGDTLADLLIQSDLWSQSNHGLMDRRRSFATTISRVMSGHCSIRVHLERFKIVVGTRRSQILMGLVALNKEEGTPIRDLCALQKWAALKLWHRFLREYGMKIEGCHNCF